MPSELPQGVATTAEAVVDWLASEIPATGRVVVCMDLALRKPQRLEVETSEAEGAFSEADRFRLVDAIDAAGSTEGWIAGEVDNAGVWGTMVWHIVDDGLHPLTASHARAVLGSFDGLLLPSDTSVDQAVDGSQMGEY